MSVEKKPQILIAGSGKMARDVGSFFLGRGHQVAWLSRDAGRLAKLERWVHKRIRRIESLREDLGGELGPTGEPSFFELGSSKIPRAEVFIECINEAEEDKRIVLEALDGVIPDDAIRVTNSSSIFPDALHAECAGLHFFYPVEMTGFVEAVFPEGFSEERRRRLLSLLEDTRLECIEEETDSAFAVNRLLLPVQAETMGMIIDGWNPRRVDEASSSPILPVGQLTLMDSIGLDVVYPAVCNFMGRMDDQVASLYEPLRDGLRQLLDLGKLGKKNKDGFLMGSELPWSIRDESEGDLEYGIVGDRLRCLFVNTCFHAIERDLIASEKLTLALTALFGWERELVEALSPLAMDDACDTLAAAYESSGRLYFVPAPALRGKAETLSFPEHGPLV